MWIYVCVCIFIEITQFAYPSFAHSSYNTPTAITFQTDLIHIHSSLLHMYSYIYTENSKHRFYKLH